MGFRCDQYLDGNILRLVLAAIDICKAALAEHIEQFKVAKFDFLETLEAQIWRHAVDSNARESRI